MKKRLIRKVQAIILTTCVVLSTFDMTAIASTTSTDTLQAQGTEIIDKADTTDIEGTTDTTTTSDSTDETTSEQSTDDTQTTRDSNSNSTQDTTTDPTTSTDETLTETQDTTTQKTETTAESETDSTLTEEETKLLEEDTQTEDTVERTMGYNSADNLVIPSRYDGSFYPNEQGTLPSNYDSRNYGYITPVRDQGSWGTCWSFSAIGMAEANIVKKGLAGNTLDLSELQLAYFFYHTVADPLGNTTGDSTQALQASYLQQGGNSVFTTFALASWIGAADESKAPYGNATSEGYSLDNSLAFSDAYHMQNSYWINMNDRNDVKTMIMEYGAVATSYNSYQNGNTTTTYYNGPNKAYYYDGAYGSNHAIIIVGWDDSFSNTNFNATHRPSSNGAWLVKNSWGTEFGNSGYFWISYQDSAFNDANYSKAYVFDFEAADNYDHNYQYDGSSGGYGYAVYNGGSIANVFTAKANSSGGAEQVEAVSFALYDVNVDYSIQIYKNLTNGQDPTSGTPMLSTPKTGTTSYVGYYTVPLDEMVAVGEGDTFSVVVTLSRSASSYAYYFCDYTYQNSDWIGFTNSQQAGQSFTKLRSDSSWADLSDLGMTARVKAFTSDIDISTSISLDSSLLTLKIGETTTLNANIEPNTAYDKSVTWSSANDSIATVNTNGYVTAVGVGNTVITATTENGLTATCQVNVQALEVLPASISLNNTSITMKFGESTTLSAIIAPDNATNKSVTWGTSNEQVVTVDSNGLVTITGVGTATITATTANGITAACQVTGTMGAVTGLVAQSQSTKSIKLTWTKQNGVSGYVIYRYNSKSKKYVKIGTNKSASSNTFINKSLKPATTYKYKVRAYTKINGKTVYSSYSSILTTSTKTVTPTLKATAASKSAKLTWGKVSGASGYEIYMSTSKSGEYSLVKTITKGKSVSYTKKSLTKKQTYYYKIRTYKTVSGIKIYSNYSKVKSVKAK